MSLACRYTFRLLIGAGQSKIGARSSACWIELTCTQTHYYTQPMPNAFAWLFHRLPPWVHRLEVALTFAEQLGLPFLVLMPSRTLQTGACLAELMLQLGIVGTGNYAWINFVGAVPALALLDDRFLSRLLPASMVAAARAAAAADEADADAPSVATGTTALPSVTAAATATAAMSESEIEPLVGERRGERAAARAPRPRSFGARLYSFYRLLLHSALLGFLLCKSAAPLKELFTPGTAPRMRGVWIESARALSACGKGRGKGEGGRGSVWIESARALSSPFPLPPHPPLLPFPLVYPLSAASLPISSHLVSPSRAAPWLNYYDDWFFVNAQGVFGFVNRHRLNLALEYTHDPLPVNRSASARSSGAGCHDTRGTIGTGPNGVSLTCRAARAYCGSSSQLQQLCPRSCGRCEQTLWTENALSQVTWRPLELPNLPGATSRRPGFNSPYHYRLSWEAWIATTASMEHVVERHLERSQRMVPLEELPIPALLSTLISKVLRGDTDAIGLLETPETALLLRAHDVASDGGGSRKNASGTSSATRPKPPTAVRYLSITPLMTTDDH